MSISRFIEMEQFYHFYQPIFDINNGIKIGHEMLLRSDIYPNPEIPFQLAKKEDQLYELDSRSIRKAIYSYHTAGSSSEIGILFVNIYPSSILNPNFPSFINQIVACNYVESQRVVLELSESEIIEDMKGLKKRISGLKNDGFLIALDDIGKGYSCIQSIIELEADYLKLDRYFAQDLHICQKKQEFIYHLKKFCENTRSQLILEGVELEEELEVAKALGISVAQGYFLGKPALLKKSFSKTQ
ncbi:diguanylate cyclase/phosphodiesterase [Bacillus freudenreichii]|nr:diguanylate cyclase/phosphodiesterase [Bacillus freudenreichii]